MLILLPKLILLNVVVVAFVVAEIILVAVEILINVAVTLSPIIMKILINLPLPTLWSIRCAIITKTLLSLTITTLMKPTLYPSTVVANFSSLADNTRYPGTTAMHHITTNLAKLNLHASKYLGDDQLQVGVPW